MFKSPLFRIIGQLNVSLESLASALNMPMEMLDILMQEKKVNYTVGYEFTPGSGLPQVVARDIAMALGVHRAYLEDPGYTDPDVIYKNQEADLNSSVDGVLGTAIVRLQGISGAMRFYAFESVCDDLTMIAPSALCSGLTTGAFGFIMSTSSIEEVYLKRGLLSRSEEIRMERDMDLKSEGSQIRYLDDLEDIEPEYILGIKELIALFGSVEEALHARSLKPAAGYMSKQYITALRKFWVPMEHLLSLEFFKTVTLYFRDGRRRDIVLKTDYCSSLAAFYAASREGEMPPFLILTDEDWVRSFSVDSLSMVVFPWTLIEANAAHLDIDLASSLVAQMLDPASFSADDEQTDPEDDEPDVLELSDDLLRRKRMN